MIEVRKVNKPPERVHDWEIGELSTALFDLLAESLRRQGVSEESITAMRNCTHFRCRIDQDGTRVLELGIKEEWLQ